MQKMNNKKGVKLLAAVMVLAIALAGAFFITGSSDDVDATTAVTLDKTFTADGSITATTWTNVLVSSEGKTVTISVNAVMAAPLTIYVMDGTTLDLKIGVDQTANIIVKTAKADFATTKIVENSLADSAITLAGAKAGSDYKLTDNIMCCTVFQIFKIIDRAALAF